MQLLEDFTGKCRGIQYDYSLYCTDGEFILESYLDGEVEDRVTWYKNQSNYKLILSMIEEIKTR